MNAKINIITKQYENEKQSDIIKQIFDANIHYKNDDIYIIYKDKEEDKATTTTIKISKEKVSIKRFGDINSTIIFEKDKCYETKYRTSQGLFIIEIKTRQLNIDKNREKCIKLNIDYDIKILDLFNGRNKIDILVEIKE